MFETGVRQFRMAMAMVGGRRINPRVIERLAGDVLATLQEFGAPGDDVGELLDGPLADPESREHFQLQALRRTLRRLGARSAFYGKLLAGFDVRQLTLDQFQEFPLTTKADLVSRGPDMICEGATPFPSTRTTGTTGRPAEVWMSAYEARLWPALAALSGSSLWNRLPAVAAGRVHEVPGAWINTESHHAARGLARVARLLHPEAFPA